MRHEVIVGIGRRRCWSGVQKLTMLSEVSVGGATVTEVERRHDLTRQDLYNGAGKLRRKGLWPYSGETRFLPLEPALEEPEVPERLQPGA